MCTCVHVTCAWLCVCACAFLRACVRVCLSIYFTSVSQKWLKMFSGSEHKFNLGKSITTGKKQARTPPKAIMGLTAHSCPLFWGGKLDCVGHSPNQAAGWQWFVGRRAWHFFFPTPHCPVARENFSLVTSLPDFLQSPHTLAPLPIPALAFPFLFSWVLPKSVTFLRLLPLDFASRKLKPRWMAPALFLGIRDKDGDSGGVSRRPSH